MSNDDEITRLLQNCEAGDPAALKQLFPKVYAELRKIAAAYMQRESWDHTLQPTALVHESYMKLINQRIATWRNRSHFYGVAAQAMRRILADHARSQKRQKRGGGAVVATFDENMPAAGAMHPHKDQTDFDRLDSALSELEKLSARQSQIVELKFYSGLSFDEIARSLEISPATVSREWNAAKAWLLLWIKNHDSAA